MNSRRVFLLVFLLGIAVVLTAAAPLRPHSTLADSQISFIQNVGQLPEGILYQLRGAGGTLWLNRDAIWLTYRTAAPAPTADERLSGTEFLPPELQAESPTRPQVNLRLRFGGAVLPTRITPFAPQGTAVHYFSGSDPAGWHTNVPVWGGVLYADLYPGIDLELTSVDGSFMPRLVCRSGCGDSLEQVRLEVEGADGLRVENGRLHLETAAGRLTMPLFEVIDADGHALGTAVPTPQVEGTLVTHPFAQPAPAAHTSLTTANSSGAYTTEFIFSTFLGGVGGDGTAGTAVAPNGDIFITGTTSSADFPVTPGAHDISLDETDAYIVRLDPSGNHLIYATFLEDASPRAIQVDTGGRAFVTGDASEQFPTTPGAFDTLLDGESDAFLTRLAADGSQLLFSTLIGGSRDERGRDLAVDTSGSAYVAGLTNSHDFPTTAGAFDPSFQGICHYRGEYECPIGFVVKFNAQGSALLYSTYLGGEEELDSFGDGIQSIAIDAQGHAYVTGFANSADFPTTPGAFSTVHSGGGCVTSGLGWGYRCYEAFVTKLNPSGTELVYSTFLGDTQNDEGNAIAVDAAGQAHVAGYTSSPEFPTTPGAFATELSGGICDYYYQIPYTFPCPDAFVTKLNAAGSGLVYATFLGGGGDDTYWEEALALTVDAGGNAYVSGHTDSTQFPTTSRAYSHLPNETFVARLNQSAGLDYSTYLGGSSRDSIGSNALAMFPDGTLLLGGSSESSDFPTTAGVLQPLYAGGTDGFLIRADIRVPDPNAGWQPVGAGAATGGGISANLGESGWPGMAISPDGRIYVAWHDNSSGNYEIYVKRWNGAGWEEVGTHSARLGGISSNAGESRAVSLAVAPNGMPYVAWHDNASGDFEIYVRCWNGSAWQEVGAGSATGGGVSNNSGDSRWPSLAIDNGDVPYLAWYDSSGGDYEIYVRRWNGSTWQEVGAGSAMGGGISDNSGNSYLPSIAIASDGLPYVAWQDETPGPGEIYVKRWNGSVWVPVGSGGASGGGISDNAGHSAWPILRFGLGDAPLVVWIDDSSGNHEVYVSRFDGTSWVDVGRGSASGGGISLNGSASDQARLAIAPNGTPYVGWYDAFDGDDEIYVRRWNGARWEEVGVGSATGGGVSDNSGNSGLLAMAVDANGIPYVTWGDYTSGNFEIYVRRFGTPLCYPLTRTHTGSGSDPAAAPDRSYGCAVNYYTAGTTIGLTAAPSAGWRVESWSGTGHDDSRATTNVVTMPPQAHAVGVNYAPLPRVHFTSSSYVAGEDAGTAVVNVILSATSSDTIRVNYASHDGTATAGQDYTSVSGTLTFAPGESQKAITVPLLDDAVDESDETLTLTLSSTSGAVLGSPATSVLTILDNDDAGPTPTITPTATPTPVPGRVTRVLIPIAIRP